MKKKVIRIQDISQIDTGKISVYDLNNRYIDPMGNMYGLKYDRISHRVEIVKLQRIHTSEIHSYKRKIFENKSHAAEQDETEDEYSTSVSDINTENDKLFFEPDVFIDSVINDSDTHRERIKGIIMNIDESGVFPKENKSESLEIEGILRNLDIEGIQQLDKLESYHRELTSFPRSLTYYQAKIGKDGRELLDHLSNNKERTMRFIFLYEMEETISRVYKNLRKHLLTLEELLKKKNIDEIAGVTKHAKQSFTDAVTSMTNTIDDVDSTLTRTNLLKEYALNKSNY